MTERVASLIGGLAVTDGEAVEIRNPSDLDETVGEAIHADAAIVDDAVSTARRGARMWRDTPLMDRARILLEASRLIATRKSDIARVMSREQGKILADATAEVQRAADMFAYFAGEVLRSHGELYPSMRPDSEVEVLREPVGVVAAITPWNFPVAIPATKCAAALAYGNAVVLKPSEITPVSTARMIDCVLEAGVPPDTLGVLIGDGALGAALAAHRQVDAISFTGSVDTGRKIKRAAAETEAQLQLEMGGKNAWVVLDDADPALAARLAAESAFLGSGQRCTASSIVLATPGIADALHEHLRHELGNFPVGHALDPDARLGPLVSAAQYDKVGRYLNHAAMAGADAIAGPIRPTASRGYFRPAMLFARVDPALPITTEEVFGPVLATIDVGDLDEAIEIANRSPYGLSAGICTRSLAAARHFKTRVEAGIVTVNLPTAGSELHVPFGGIKASSFGPREVSSHARHFFTRTRTVYISSPESDRDISP